LGTRKTRNEKNIGGLPSVVCGHHKKVHTYMLNQPKNSTINRGVKRAIAEFVAIARPIGTRHLEGRR
jgi:hypothetical protein